MSLGWGKATEVTFHRPGGDDPIGRYLDPGEVSVAADSAAIYGTEDELAELGARLTAEFGPWRKVNLPPLPQFIRIDAQARRDARRARKAVVAAARRLVSEGGKEAMGALVAAVLTLNERSEQVLSEVDGGGDHEGEAGGDEGEREPAVRGQREDAGEFNLGRRSGAREALELAERRVRRVMGLLHFSEATAAEIVRALREEL